MRLLKGSLWLKTFMTQTTCSVQ